MGIQTSQIVSPADAIVALQGPQTHKAAAAFSLTPLLRQKKAAAFFQQEGCDHAKIGVPAASPAVHTQNEPLGMGADEQMPNKGFPVPGLDGDPGVWHRLQRFPGLGQCA